MIMENHALLLIVNAQKEGFVKRTVLVIVSHADLGLEDVVVKVEYARL